MNIELLKKRKEIQEENYKKRIAINEYILNIMKKCNIYSLTFEHNNIDKFNNVLSIRYICIVIKDNNIRYTDGNNDDISIDICIKMGLNRKLFINEVRKYNKNIRVSINNSIKKEIEKQSVLDRW